MKTVVITGSSRGIGLGLATEFLKRYCCVVICARSKDKLDQEVINLGNEFGADRVMGKTCDMNKYEEVALHLKNADLEWFEENIIHTPYEQNQIFLGYMSPVKVTANDLNGRIKKELALQAFNHIYTNQQVNMSQLGKYLKAYGIRSERSRKVGDDNWYYAWD